MVAGVAGGYAQEVMRALDDAGVRAVLDSRPERLEKKIFDAREKQVPLLVVVGSRDERDRTIGIRMRDGRHATVSFVEGVERLMLMAPTPAMVSRL
jgi:threonyl-tRNA synthetase